MAGSEPLGAWSYTTIQRATLAVDVTCHLTKSFEMVTRLPILVLAVVPWAIPLTSVTADQVVAAALVMVADPSTFFFSGAVVLATAPICRAKV